MNEMSNTFLKIWLILWVIGLPLIHIHPEADHAHGMPGHQHGGTFHTVLSGNPACAYEGHQHHHDSFSPGESFGTLDSPSHPSHGVEHSTYDFSVLNLSIDPIHEGNVSNSTSAAVGACETETPGSSFVSRTDSSPPEIPFSILPKNLSPRAPPILLV